MKWNLVGKDKKWQPTSGTYSDWKEQIAKECSHQCVYCCISEDMWGGIDHFHIDHFRPKSIFASLENDILNLFYACPVCNRFKSDDWKEEPNVHSISYLDPSVTDYNTVFELDPASFQLKGLYLAARYMLERLYLNRPQLIHQRRDFLLRSKRLELSRRVSSLLPLVKDADLVEKGIQTIMKLTELEHLRVRPYALSEIRKST